jgi:GT2 family glycosyltransferase
MSVDLSISIVSYKAKGYLERCLTSVYAGTTGIALEVIVVDNDSRDGTADMVWQSFPQVRFVGNDANLGFAHGTNQGMRLAEGDFVLLLNCDTEVYDGALERMIGFLRAHPDAGAVGCRLLNSDGTLQFSARKFNSFATEFFEHTYLDRLFRHSKVFGQHLLGGWDYNSMREVDWVTGACLMTRREVIETVGLLDERFFMFAEDADWCWRVREYGRKVYFIPDAQVLHHGGGSSQTLVKEMEMEKYKSKYRLFIKHRRYALFLFSVALINASLMAQTIVQSLARVLRLHLPVKISSRLAIASYCLRQHVTLARAGWARTWPTLLRGRKMRSTDPG